MLGNALAAHLSIVRFVPNDGHFFKRCLGTPPAVGHHRNGVVIEFHNPLDAAFFKDGSCIKGFEFALKHRRGFDGRVEHVFGPVVNRVLERPIDLVGRIQAFGGFARNGPILGVFEANGFDVGWAQESGLCAHLSIVQ